MRQNDKIDILKRVPLFSGLTKKQLRFLTRQVTEMHLGSGTVLATEGEQGREAMVIVSGSAEVRRKGRRIADLGPGTVLGEMSLISERPRNATVTAASDMVVLHMGSREFFDVLEAYPDVSLEILRTVAARLKE